jgi:hypothetical protein
VPPSLPNSQFNNDFAAILRFFYRWGPQVQLALQSTADTYTIARARAGEPQQPMKYSRRLTLWSLLLGVTATAAGSDSDAIPGGMAVFGTTP